MQRVSVIFQLFLVAAVLTAVQGCNNEDGPTGPEPGAVATIANIWPHEDGNSWTYDLHNSFAAENGLGV